MSSTGAMTLPESEAPQQPLPRRPTRKITIGPVVTTLALSVLATLLGPLGVLQSGSAAAPHEAGSARRKVGDAESHRGSIGRIHAVASVGSTRWARTRPRRPSSATTTGPRCRRTTAPSRR